MTDDFPGITSKNTRGIPRKCTVKPSKHMVLHRFTASLIERCQSWAKRVSKRFSGVVVMNSWYPQKMECTTLSRNPKSLGRWGEEYATTILQRDGYQILDRNWRSKEGELDIVCYKEDSLVFVEVKTRRKLSRAYPLNESVSNEKEQRLYQLAALYRRANRSRLKRLSYKSCRFDLFAIAAYQHPKPYIRHYEGAFGIQWRQFKSD